MLFLLLPPDQEPYQGCEEGEACYAADGDAGDYGGREGLVVLLFLWGRWGVVV